VSLTLGDVVPHIIFNRCTCGPENLSATSQKDFCNNICQEETYAPQQIWGIATLSLVPKRLISSNITLIV
jgi:hypothetical protein